MALDNTVSSIAIGIMAAQNKYASLISPAISFKPHNRGLASYPSLQCLLVCLGYT